MADPEASAGSIAGRPVGDPDLLATIVAATRRTLEIRRERQPTATLERRAAERDPRGTLFRERLRRRETVNIIAECKRRSPSRGVLRRHYDPAALAEAYAAAGAAAVSVLTEPTFFDGSLAHLSAVRDRTDVPVLRKDFIVDDYQLLEARAAGADAVLLIVAAVSPRELGVLLRRSRELGLAALVEVHDDAEAAIALAEGADIVGVNNRNLRTLDVSIEVSQRLIGDLLGKCVAVAESGLTSAREIERLSASGFEAFLMGERFMTRPDPGGELAAFVAGNPPARPPDDGALSAMTAVKFCGITRVDDALAAAAAGASAIGLVFWPRSPRAVTRQAARSIVEALPPHVLAIGVFVNASPGEVAMTVVETGLGGAQLHGEEWPEDYLDAAPWLIKAAAVADGRLLADPDAWPGAVTPLLDAHDPARRGGTGRQVDWDVAAGLARRRAMTLSGGLQPESVATAIRVVSPAWVDVSSGIESRPGRKDAAKMAAFMDAVRSADRADDPDLSASASMAAARKEDTREG